MAESTKKHKTSPVSVPVAQASAPVEKPSKVRTSVPKMPAIPKRKKAPKLARSEKAYKDMSFINSTDARLLRIMAEYLYPNAHFKREHVGHTIIFFGSARILSAEDWTVQYNAVQNKLATAKSDKSKHDAQAKLKRLQLLKPYIKHYEDCVELAQMVTEWSMTLKEEKRFLVCSGGGPGIMEAANRGAFEANGKSIGLNISLPFEQNPNPFITPSLNFEFHYFFMRKYWFSYFARAFVVMPGGFGTMDEFFELLTLVQTRKIKRQLPIILYGSEFWKKLFDMDFLAQSGMISPEDIRLFKYADSPQEAFDYLTAELQRIHGL